MFDYKTICIEDDILEKISFMGRSTGSNGDYHEISLLILKTKILLIEGCCIRAIKRNEITYINIFSNTHGSEFTNDLLLKFGTGERIEFSLPDEMDKDVVAKVIRII